MRYLEMTFYGNSLRDWVVAVLVAAVIFSALELLREVIVRHLGRLSKRTSTFLDNAAVAALRGSRRWFFVIVALGFASEFLALPPTVRGAVDRAMLLAFLLQLAIWGGTAIRAYVQEYTIARAENDAASVSTVRALAFILNVVVWAILFLMALDNFGNNITAMVAGFGIGGIAIALAVQNISVASSRHSRSCWTSLSSMATSSS